MARGHTAKDRDQTKGGTTKATKLTASKAMCYHCFDTLMDHYVTTQSQSFQTKSSSSPPAFAAGLENPKVSCPIFVTWEKRPPSRKSPLSLSADQKNDDSSTWQLRGCIGSLSPRLLVSSVGEYAIISSQQDKRFQPIDCDEVPQLRVAVSLLVEYEECSSVFDWTVGIHGILIKFQVRGRTYSATFLPEVASDQGWDQKTTIQSLVQKAGYHGAMSIDLLQSIQCTRYQSSKCKITFDEYIRDHCNGVVPPAVVEGNRSSSNPTRQANTPESTCVAS